VKLVEPLGEDPSFFSRPMFGMVACYLRGRIVAVLADRGVPWQGLLLPVERAVQQALLEEFPALRVHPVLPKWLYLTSTNGRFAGVAADIVERIAAGDERFGVEPKPRLPRRKKV